MDKQKRLSPSELREKKRYSIFDTSYLCQIFLSHKKWFALSWLLCLCLAAAYIYFTRPAYSVRGRMVIVEKRGSSSSNVAIMLQGQLPSSLSNNMNVNLGVENEKEILQSKWIARDVVNDLGLYTEYRLQKWFKKRLLYKTQPINVEVSPKMLQSFDNDLPLVNHSISMSINKDNEGYEVEVRLKENQKKTDLPKQMFKSLPAVVHTELGDLTLTENMLLTPSQKKRYQQKDYSLNISIVPPMTAARRFAKKMSVSSASKKALYTINLDIRDENIMRGMDYVNGLIKFYNERNNSEKHKEVEKSDEFVTSRLVKIDAELDSADAKWEQNKKKYQVMDAKADAEEVIGKKSSYESQLVNFGIQQQLLDYLSEYVNDPANRYELIPVNVGVYSGDAVSMIGQHNQLVNDRKMLLKSVTEQSAQVKQVTQMIDELHPIIQTAFKRDKESLLLRKRVAEREYNKYMGRVGSAPEQERVLTEIGRNRSIKQGVYLTLLQKREENAMELISTTDKGRKIDETIFLMKTKPRTLVALALAVAIGFLVPYIVFFMRRKMKKKIESEADLKLLTRLPLIGNLLAPQKDDDEAFREIRANMLYRLKDGKKTVLVTSADDGDGKTFCSVRLAEAFAKMGEKTILCDLNFRHPSIAKEYGVASQTGLASLLQEDSLTKAQIMSSVMKTSLQGLDILPAGIVNTTIHPADLLAHRSICQVMDSMREAYDIVILDCSAIGKYCDALIDGLADVTCFICKSGKTKKVSIEKLEGMKEDHRLPDPCLIITL